MKVADTCSICGKPAFNKCILCGNSVCGDHVDSKGLVCMKCISRMGPDRASSGPGDIGGVMG